MSVGAFGVVMFEFEVFWFVMLRSFVIGYECFGGPRCLHLQGLPKYYPTTTVHGVTIQKTSTKNILVTQGTLYEGAGITQSV
jgi:hypothetical protein